MAHSNPKSPIFPRAVGSSEKNIHSRSNSPTNAIRSKALSPVVPDVQSVSSSQSLKSYPRKGTTLGNANLTMEELSHLEEVLARFDKFRQVEDTRVNGTHGFSSTSPAHSLLCGLQNLAPTLPTSFHFFLTPSPQCHLRPRRPNRRFPSGFHSTA
ncbi:unnamed protein product [Heterobilharzia americana]|nr:unnamed protein product [Heterobilharzia americana]